MAELLPYIALVLHIALVLLVGYFVVLPMLGAFFHDGDGDPNAR